MKEAREDGNMKLTAKRPADLDVAAIRIVAAVRYEEEDIPNDFPFRRGDVWDVTVEADTGRIRGWPEGRTGDVHMKVADQGSYYLLDKEGKVIASREEDYVPRCIPGEYGDYLIFQIRPDGTVKDWGHYFMPNAIRESFFGDD
jgi:hypothetical protein